MRPRVIAEMRELDPKIAKQVDLVPPYIELGAVDLVYQVLFDALDEDPKAWVTRWDVHVWGPESAAFRRDPRYGATGTAHGVPGLLEAVRLPRRLPRRRGHADRLLLSDA